MVMVKPASYTGKYIRNIFLLLFIGIAIFVLLPQVKAFSGSLDKLSNVDYRLAIVAAVFTIGTYLAAAATYYFLALKPLPYRQLTIIQFAAMFINRILPAGIGAIGVSFGYLKAKRHSNVQAGTVVSINNFLGFIGNSLIILLAILISGIKVPENSMFDNNWLFLLIFLPGLLFIMFFLINTKRRKKLIVAVKDLQQQLMQYTNKPSKIIYSLTTSSVLSLLNFLSLYVCVYAVGGSTSLAVVILVYSFGIGLGSSIPTPGGLGAIEAGMVAGFVALGMTAPTALAAVILYRLISFWFMLIAGLTAFVYTQKNNLIQLKLK